MKHIAFLRGINVGGKNKIPMSELKSYFEELEFKNVLTYINSGNVIFDSEAAADKVSKQINTALAKNFRHTPVPIKVLVISYAQLKTIVKKAPKGFGQEPTKYYSDVAFMIDVTADEAFAAFELNPEVDAIWLGPGVVYFRRLSAKRTKSCMSKIAGRPIYKSMTIRSWNTATKLLSLMS